jgi:hypothetical protein
MTDETTPPDGTPLALIQGGRKTGLRAVVVRLDSQDEPPKTYALRPGDSVTVTHRLRVPSRSTWLGRKTYVTVVRVSTLTLEGFE